MPLLEGTIQEYSVLLPHAYTQPIGIGKTKELTLMGPLIDVHLLAFGLVPPQEHLTTARLAHRQGLREVGSEDIAFVLFNDEEEGFAVGALAHEGLVGSAVLHAAVDQGPVVQLVQ